jgi:hypothetical protein
MGIRRCSQNFWTDRLERELQMVELSATRCSCIAILWVSLVSSATIILYVASQLVFIVVSVNFFIDSVRKLLDTHSYLCCPCYIDPCHHGMVRSRVADGQYGLQILNKQQRIADKGWSSRLGVGRGAKSPHYKEPACYKKLHRQDRDQWWPPAGAGNFCLHHRVQNCSGAHPASYPMGTRGSFPGGKAAGA